MRKVSKNFIALAGLLAGINILGLFWIHYELTESPKPTTRIISLSVLPNEDSASRISLTFDRNMISSENIGQPEKASILKLTPEWPGEWIWSAPDKIEYNLTEKLPLGRVFRISSTEAFKDRTGRKYRKYEINPVILLICYFRGNFWIFRSPESSTF